MSMHNTKATCPTAIDIPSSFFFDTNFSSLYQQKMTRVEEDIKASCCDGISHFADVVFLPPPVSPRRPAPPDAAAVAVARPQHRAQSKTMSQSSSSGVLDGGCAEDNAKSAAVAVNIPVL